MRIINPEAFKKWLSTTLVDRCNADPNILAKYIVALLKKDEPEHILKKDVVSKLKAFTEDGTEAFVNLLFKTIQSKEYLVKFYEVEDDFNANQKQRDVNLRSSRQLDERHTPCLAESDSQPQISTQASRRSYSPGRHYKRKRGSSPCRRSRSRSPSSERSVYGIQTVENCTQSTSDATPGITRCRDFHERGICIRGDMCLFDHGSEALVVAHARNHPIFDQIVYNHQYNSLPPLPCNNRSSSASALIEVPIVGVHSTNCSLFIYGIPTELNTSENLQKYFSRFGIIKNISVNYKNNPTTAVISFSTHQEAKLAMNDPAPILQNRFIQSLWFKNKLCDQKPDSAPQDVAIQLQRKSSTILLDLLNEEQRLFEKFKNPSLNAQQKREIFRIITTVEESIKKTKKTLGIKRTRRDVEKEILDAELDLNNCKSKSLDSMFLKNKLIKLRLELHELTPFVPPKKCKYVNPEYLRRKYCLVKTSTSSSNNNNNSKNEIASMDSDEDVDEEPRSWRR